MGEIKRPKSEGVDAPSELEYYRKLSQTLNRMRKTRKLTDVTILIDNKPICAHKNILSASSSYFDAMFANVENKQSTGPEVILLQDVDHEVVESIIEFVYTSKIIITDDNVKSIFSGALLLKVDPIQEACIKHINQKLNADNCLEVKKFAEKHSCHKLLQTTNSYILDNFAAIAKSQEFLKLEADNFISIIKDDELNCPEEKVYEAVVRWITANADWFSNLTEIMKHVRFALMKPEYLSEITVNSQPEEAKSTRFCEWWTYVDEAKSYQLNPEIRKIRQGPRFRRRKRSTSLFLFDSYNGVTRYVDIKPNDRAIMYPQANKQSKLGSGDSFRVVPADDFIYIIRSLSAIEKYHPQKGSALDVPPPPQSLEVDSEMDVGGVVLGEFLYIVGKVHNNLKYVAKYSQFKKKWFKCAETILEHVRPEVVTLKGLIYVLGGTSNSRLPMTSVECYDPATNKWILVCSLSEPRRDLACTIAGEYIYAIGSKNNLLYSGERYDPMTNKWEEIPPIYLSQIPSNCTMPSLCFASMNGLLYTTPKKPFQADLKEWYIYIYDPIKQTWSKRPLGTPYAGQLVAFKL